MKLRPTSKVTPMTVGDGFTLIEVLVALAIFSIGILAVAGLQIKSVNQNAAARMQTEATALSVEWLERLKTLPFDHNDLDEGANPHQSQAGSYTVSWNVIEDIHLPLKTITVTVTGANPNVQPVSVSSMKAQ